MNNDNATYLAFTPETTEEQARAAFVRRYGKDPEKAFLMHPTRMMCVGPVPALDQEEQKEQETP